MPATVRHRELPRLALVARVLFDLLRLDDEIGDGARLQGEVPRGKDAHADGLASAPRQHDLLIEAVLGDGEVDFA